MAIRSAEFRTCDDPLLSDISFPSSPTNNRQSTTRNQTHVSFVFRLLESGIATGGPGAVKQAYLTCLALFAVVSLKTAVENQYFYGLTNLGIGMRGALSTVSLCGSCVVCLFCVPLFCACDSVSVSLSVAV